MSKALGGYGGFIAGTMKLTEMIRDRSATYQASTALPPPIAAAGIASMKIIRDNPDLRVRLLDLATGLREAITGMDFRTTHQRTPIIPVIFDTAEQAENLSLFLEENGFIVPCMNYPAREQVHQVRIAVSVNHTSDQIERLLELLKQWKEKYETK
jgi:7-keto-8-aminopelargonate synthetase-like enzyme